MADRLIIDFDGARCSFDTADVVGVVETQRSFIPGRAGFVTGIISLRGEPVAVVDLRKALGHAPMKKSGEGQGRVVVVGRKNRVLGFDVGSATVSFLWESPAAAGEARAQGDDVAARPVDWGRIFDETAGLLSMDGS